MLFLGCFLGTLDRNSLQEEGREGGGGGGGDRWREGGRKGEGE